MIEAVLFDVDGTLYHQAPLRLLMAGELATIPCLQPRPWRASRLWRTLREFRHVREELRALGQPADALERLQYRTPAARLGVTVDEVEAAVGEWILRRPLKYLSCVARPGVRDLFLQLHSRRVAVGVFSDYPVHDKLEALGLADLVSLALEATSADVNAFKPHPRGFLRACEHWSLRPDQVLYVGDRSEVDAAGAAAAGMPCTIIGAAAAGRGERFATIREIGAVLDVMRAPAAYQERSL